MKKVTKSLLGATLFALVAAPMVNVNALEVSDEESLRKALEEGGTVELTQDVVVNNPLLIKKATVVNGNGHSIIAGTNFVRDGQNGTVISGINKSNSTLKNLVIDNESTTNKYGVQSHGGSTITLDGVTIKNVNWGAILANAGHIVIKDLVMESTGYGIELSISKEIVNPEQPTITMDGTLSVKDLKDPTAPIHIDNKNGLTTEAKITNTSTSEVKITVEKDENDIPQFVAKTEEGTEVFETKLTAEFINGSTLKTVTEEQATVKPEGPKEEPKEEEKEENPKTSDKALVYVTMAALGLGAVTLTYRKVSE